jgi:hypothetical protein
MNRFSTAMWDFSWATRRFGNEAEYADWDKVLDELSERGYDNVRIDAFPHLIAADRNDTVTQKVAILPQRRRFMWGNHNPVEITPRQDLIGFIRKCSERKLTVGLSSWYIPDSASRHEQVCTPEDFTRIWDETLQFIDDAGLLGAIKWVDLCNEFPVDLWAPGAARNIFGTRFKSPLGVGIRGLPWRKIWSERTQAYLTDAVGSLRKKWPTLKFCYSFCELTGPQLRSLDVSNFDVAEIHCWLTDSIPWSMSSLQLASLMELPMGTEMHAKRMASVPVSTLKEWLDEVLTPRMKTWSDWASENSLPLITTEGWGPTNYCDLAGVDDEWKWVRQFSELAVERSIELGWTGICTNNFCQPHHVGMWSDVSWHRELTDAIRNSQVSRVIEDC